ncbi:hypothetical protein D9M69_611160 [compost metagenome]
MWLYASQDEYNFISSMYLMGKLKLVMNAPSLRGHFMNGEALGSDAHRQRQRQIEIDLAERIAAIHNWGSVRRITMPVMSLPTNVQNYVDEFAQVVGRGDWRSLRCSDELMGLPGLRMQPLKLN